MRHLIKSFFSPAGFVIAVVMLFHADVVIAEKIDGDRLLDPDRVIEIKIVIPSDDWTQLSRQSRNPATAFSGLPSDNPYTYFKADFWLDGNKIESVGIRKKGFFGSADVQRPSLKIKFDEYEKQDPIKGLNQLTLNNNLQDRSQLSQFLTYRLFRNAGNPAPRCNWAHVIVNGKSLGVYSNVESIGKPFLSKYFGDKSGNLYEGTLTDFHPKAIANLEVKTNEEKNDLSDIKRLAELLAAKGDLNLDEVGQLINLDAFFRHWALESLTGYWDGYSSNQNNYFLYFNPKDQGRGQFIPWGADWAFTSNGPFGGGPVGFGGGGTTVIYAQGILANRLYHTKGVPERYRATMQQLLKDVWDEEKMLTEIDRVEKLVAPHLHQSQASTAEALNEVREFIRGRRGAVEQALKQWRPNIPAEPRKPAYVIDVGKASGSFSTVFSNGQPRTGQSKSDVRVELNGNVMEFVNVSVAAVAFHIPGFGVGGPPGGPPGGGFRTPPGPEQDGPAKPPAAPVSLIFAGDRTDGQKITLTLIIDRSKFQATTENALQVTGSYQEGRGGGFGGFGNGPRRSIVGELRLKTAGTEQGHGVSGDVNLRIVETHGGVFQPQPPAGGFQGPGSVNAPRSFGQPQPLTLLKGLDTDRDGTISAAEIEQAAAALKLLDRNRDGKLSDDELQDPRK